MDSMEPLLRTLPNFRVIHLMRDPRAVALSRIEFDASARGQFTNKVTDSLNTRSILFVGNQDMFMSFPDTLFYHSCFRLCSYVLGQR